MTLNQELVVGRWIVLLENQETAGSRSGSRAFGAPVALVPTRGPGLRPWLPRATNDLDTQGHQGTMVPGSTWPPPLGPEPSCSACALPVRGLATRATNLVHGEISWRSADPGYKQLAAN